MSTLYQWENSAVYKWILTAFSLRRHDWYIIRPKSNKRIQKSRFYIFFGSPKKRPSKESWKLRELYKANQKAGGHFFALFGHFNFLFSSTVISQMEPIDVFMFTLIHFVQCVQKSEPRELLSEEEKNNVFFIIIFFLLCKCPLLKNFIREKKMKSSEPINHWHA